MGDAIKHCASNLANFSGCDSRPTFWWWVLLIVGITMVISFISGIVFAVSSIGGLIESASAGTGEEQMQAEMMQSMASGMATQVWVGVMITLVSLALLIASFVRRLRDAGLPVLIAIVPVMTASFSAYDSLFYVDKMSAIMATGDLDGINEFSLSASGWGMIGWLGYLVVIGCTLVPSKAGPSD